MTDESWADLVDRFVDGDVTPGHMFGWLVLADRPDPELLVEEARGYVAGLA